MSGKGDDRRPLSVDEKTFADNWDRIFSSRVIGFSIPTKEQLASFSKQIKDAVEAEILDGARLGANSGSNPADDGSIPSAPAIYINDDTGEQVSEDWWPGDPVLSEA